MGSEKEAPHKSSQLPISLHSIPSTRGGMSFCCLHNPQHWETTDYTEHTGKLFIYKHRENNKERNVNKGWRVSTALYSIDQEPIDTGRAAQHVTSVTLSSHTRARHHTRCRPNSAPQRVNGSRLTLSPPLRGRSPAVTRCEEGKGGLYTTHQAFTFLDSRQLGFVDSDFSHVCPVLSLSPEAAGWALLWPGSRHRRRDPWDWSDGTMNSICGRKIQCSQESLNRIVWWGREDKIHAGLGWLNNRMTSCTQTAGGLTPLLLEDYIMQK